MPIERRFSHGKEQARLDPVSVRVLHFSPGSEPHLSDYTQLIDEIKHAFEQAGVPDSFTDYHQKEAWRGGWINIPKPITR